MASKRMFQPPILKSEEDFEDWECENKIWQCVTDLEKKKQVPAIYLSLKGQARQCCDDIKVETLHSDSGIDELIKKLKTLYDKYADKAAFVAYEEFETFQRPPSMSILDYQSSDILQHSQNRPTGDRWLKFQTIQIIKQNCKLDISK